MKEQNLYKNILFEDLHTNNTFKLKLNFYIAEVSETKTKLIFCSLPKLQEMTKFFCQTKAGFFQPLLLS